jgi:RNA polymerase sigma-70 factor (ECF subfamily)
METVIADNQASASDRELVSRCQRGDRVAFRYLYRRYQHKIRSTLYQLCGRECIDDLVQEVFLRIWRGLPRLRQPEYFSTWVYRITWNVANDGRRQFAERQIENDFGEGIDGEDPRLEIPPGSRDSPDLMRLHYEDILQRGLETLSLDHRAVLVLHDLEDLPQKEIAGILQIPIGTVKSRLHHARGSLRQFLQSQGVL